MRKLVKGPSKRAVEKEPERLEGWKAISDIKADVVRNDIRYVCVVEKIDDK